MQLNQYLQIFRKNIREASTILDSRKRSAIIYSELDKLRDTYFKEDAEGFIRFIQKSYFRIKRGNREALKIPVYEYVVKNVTTSKGKHSKADGYYHFEYENDEINNPYHKDHWSNAVRYLEDEDEDEECIFNLTNVDEAFVLSNNSLSQSVEDALIKDEDSQELEETISQLTENQQRVINLHYFYGMPFKEVAEAMGCHVSNIYQINKSAIKKLTKLMKKKEVIVMKKSPSTPIVDEKGSMKDYPRWFGNKVRQEVSMGNRELENAEVRKGQLVGNRIVWEDGTFEEL
jgi:RNA polymerase sigma factor (sigma-70 family)